MRRAQRDGTGKNRTLWEGNRPLVGPFVFFAMTSIWVLCSATGVLERDPRCFTFMVGIVFSNICCQLIVAQMSNTRCVLFNWLIVPVGVTVAVALTLPTHLDLELPLLYALTAFTFLAHVHYGVCVVSLITIISSILSFDFMLFVIVNYRSSSFADILTSGASVWSPGKIDY